MSDDHEDLEMKFSRLTGDLFKAIRLCLEQRLIAPALMLLFAGIDILAGLGRPRTKRGRGGHKADFIAWADQYIVPFLLDGPTSKDLYGARCGLLHSMSSESDMSRNGQARLMFYSWGAADRNALDAAVTMLDGAQPITTVSAEGLLKAFVLGTDRFLTKAESDADLACSLTDGLNRILAKFPKEALKLRWARGKAAKPVNSLEA